MLRENVGVAVGCSQMATHNKQLVRAVEDWEDNTLQLQGAQERLASARARTREFQKELAQLEADLEFATQAMLMPKCHGLTTTGSRFPLQPPPPPARGGEAVDESKSPAPEAGHGTDGEEELLDDNCAAKDRPKAHSSPSMEEGHDSKHKAHVLHAQGSEDTVADDECEGGSGSDVSAKSDTSQSAVHLDGAEVTLRARDTSKRGAGSPAARARGPGASRSVS